ncbi:MAG TPA: hypothetical protein VGM78_00195 [Ilumatobacteraceae bacterium]
MSAVAPLPFEREERVRQSDLRRAPLQKRTINGVRLGASPSSLLREAPALTVVPRRRRAVSIVAVSCIILFGLLLGAVAFETRLAQNQLQLDKTDRAVNDARTRYDQLRQLRAELTAPDRLAVEAAQLGMAPAKNGEFMTISPLVVGVVTAAASALPNDVSDTRTSSFDQWGQVKSVTADTP